jgi:hypothetical protein
MSISSSLSCDVMKNLLKNKVSGLRNQERPADKNLNPET